MENQNPYRSPASELIDKNGDHRDGVQLASRWVRLGAALLDGLIAAAVMIPLMIVGGYWRQVIVAAQTGESVPIGTTLSWIAIGFVVFVVIQGYPLVTRGQTWAKRLLSIKIVDMDGNKPGAVRIIVLRYLTIQAIAALPYVGSWLVLVDTLFIFRRDRRCIHDHIAGTQVVVDR
ncbi:MAG: RDD family protein [Xanthomonadaceae bacterium]|jgi:uncharacterized RDD family membrane protein YckC|nr:RDD family protein [Xanthomonadaceae bacterium]